VSPADDDDDFDAMLEDDLDDDNDGGDEDESYMDGLYGACTSIGYPPGPGRTLPRPGP